MRPIDTHSHIQDSEFDDDRAEVIARARSTGVELIVALGSNERNSRKAIALSEQEPQVLAAAGIHPHEAKNASEDALDEVEELAKDRRVAMVGEIGLDFYRNLSPREDQLRVLRLQLETAGRVEKPVAIHTRDAHEAMMQLLSEWSREIGGRLHDGRPLGVMHYFAGSVTQALRYTELGFLISIHTSVTHPKASTAREIVREVPIEHLVLETDSPYGEPQRHRGGRNEPAYVVEAVTNIAAIKQMSPDEVAEATTQNALLLLMARSGPTTQAAASAARGSRE